MLRNRFRIALGCGWLALASCAREPAPPSSLPRDTALNSDTLILTVGLGPKDVTSTLSLAVANAWEEEVQADAGRKQMLTAALFIIDRREKPPRNSNLRVWPGQVVEAGGHTFEVLKFDPDEQGRTRLHLKMRQ